MNLTIAYTTARQEPMAEWFDESLQLQLGELKPKVIAVTHQIIRFPHDDPTESVFDAVIHPKPCVWSGPYRLTKHDYWSQSSYLNTSICHAPDGYIACVDDLSVLMPGWLRAVRDAMDGGYIACGAFKKVKHLIVEDGIVKDWTDYPQGEDSRWKMGVDGVAIKCPPNWFFGCSWAAPVEALLRVNGFPEACDGMGYQDAIAGQVIARHGYQFKYDRRMLTLEDEDRHHNQPAMLRIDPGKSPNDKSHALLKRYEGAKWFDNDFGPFKDLRALRKHILAGGQFPVVGRPTHDWFTHQPLSEM